MNSFIAHAGHVHGDEATAPLDAETLVITALVLLIVISSIVLLRHVDKKRAARKD